MDTTALETPRDWRAIIGQLALKWTDFVDHGLRHPEANEVFGQLPSKVTNKVVRIESNT